MNDLQLIIEKCLKRELLVSVLPKNKWKELLNRNVVFILIVLEWLTTSAIFYLYWKDISKSLLYGLFIPIISIIVIFFILVLYYLVKAINSQFGEKPELKDASKVGGIFLFGIPIVGAISGALLLHSVSAFFILILCQYISILILLILFINPKIIENIWFFLISILENIYLTIRSIPISLFILRAFGPLLLISVVLSVFSKDFWIVISQQDRLRFVIIELLLIIPSLILSTITISSITKQLIQKDVTNEEIIDMVKNNRDIQKSIRAGFISNETWQRLNYEFDWRNHNRLLFSVRQKVQKRSIFQSVILLLTTNIFLGLTIAIYLYVILSLLIQPFILSDWLSQPISSLYKPYNIFGYQFNILIPTLKITIFLATLQVIFFASSFLVDETYQNRIKDFIAKYVQNWITLLTTYEVLETPNYQVLDISTEKGKNVPIKNALHFKIIVPTNSLDEDVKIACNHLGNKYQGTNFIRIEAFEQNEDPEKYNLGFNINAWVYIFNRIRNFNKLTHVGFPELDDNIMFRHSLGIDCQNSNQPIPDDWFGNNEEAISISKAIWEMYKDKDTVMHPYASLVDKNISVEICLLKKLAKEYDYRQFIKAVTNLARSCIVDLKTFGVTLYFREHIDMIAYLQINFEADLAYYYDSNKNTHTSKVNEWLNN